MFAISVKRTKLNGPTFQAMHGAMGIAIVVLCEGILTYSNFSAEPHPLSLMFTFLMPIKSLVTPFGRFQEKWDT